MTTSRNEKEFDALKFKREAQERLQDETRGMSQEQELETYRERALSGPFGDWWKKVLEKKATRKQRAA